MVGREARAFFLLSVQRWVRLKTMKIIRENFSILSGGPGAGKTAVIKVLRARGYRCVDEVARKILQQQMKFDGGAVDWKEGKSIAK
jgi:predicted ATPase